MREGWETDATDTGGAIIRKRTAAQFNERDVLVLLCHLPEGIHKFVVLFFEGVEDVSMSISRMKEVLAFLVELLVFWRRTCYSDRQTTVMTVIIDTNIWQEILLTVKAITMPKFPNFAVVASNCTF